MADVAGSGSSGHGDTHEEEDFEREGEWREKGREGEAKRSQPKWVTPERLLLLLCVVNLINYVDRGAIASNGVNGRQGDEAGCPQGVQCDHGSGIQGEFDLSNFADGLLATAFLVGLLLFSPLFAHASKTLNPFHLIGVGLLTWTAAVFGCGLAPSFVFLLLCRMFVGVGEASFISLAAPYIDDNAPPDKTTQWLAFFYLCIPTGFAIGYIFGGVMAGIGGWRLAFLTEAAIMLPFALFFLIAPPPNIGEKRGGSGRERREGGEEVLLAGEGESGLGGSGGDEVKDALLHGNESYSDATPSPSLLPSSTSSSSPSSVAAAAEPAAAAATTKNLSPPSSPASFFEDVSELLLNPIYVSNALGYTSYTFVIGAYAYWGPKAVAALFNLSSADAMFGAITVLTGVGGTLFGGLFLDFVGPSLENAFKLQACVTFIGALLCVAAFAAPSLPVFVPLLALGEFFLFAIQGPANMVTLQSVRPQLRSLAIALATVGTHLLGDVPSPPILGAMQDSLHNWRLTFSLFTAMLLPGVASWLIGSKKLANKEWRVRHAT